ncbi:glycoside hydrolase family 43 protein [Tricladium varicosporioides]|nr:glycoside hydrolase family 43 protein [Hymenoscyphus varicosporioides]
MQAHGGGLILVNNTYYLHGENKLDGSAFQSINCYSSQNLVEWKYEGKTLSVGQGASDLATGRVVERPHVLWNEGTKKFVMWMHIDSSNYGEAKAGVATSDSVCGTYTYLGGAKPLGFESRDCNVFKDTDGTAYLLTEDRKNGLRIDKLSSDYTKVETMVYLFPELYTYEAAAMIKKGNTYFLFASDQSGWDPNDNIYTTATSLKGPWATWQNFAPKGTKTYSTQTGAVMQIGETVMYMGDRWVGSNLMRSTYVWLPLTLSGTTATLNNKVNWILDVANGGKQVDPPTETAYEAEASSNTISNGAKSASCSGCSGSKSIGYIGGSPNGKLSIPNVSSTVDTRTTIRIHYTNADKTQRYAVVSVNGEKYNVAFIPTPDDNTPGTAALTVPLKKGAVNTIEFEAYNGGWGPNIDRIMVPVS